MAARLRVWLGARAKADEPLGEWATAPVGEVLDAASRLGPFSIQGNIALNCYHIEFLFEDGSTFILRDVLVPQIDEQE
jgi:hypothetical protein